ncbi:MAG: nicotinate (nicotinamide) nucleotide adenylyltransferase [Alloprevotella sp.]
MKRTVLFGGSFNPIHNGHLALCRAVLRQRLADEVWMMVTPHNPLKVSADLMPETERYALCALATAEEPGIRASAFEFCLPRPSFTWQTLQALKKAYPDRSFSLLIGADNWQIFDRWFKAEEILASHEILIYPRPGFPLPNSSSLPCGVSIIDAPLHDISSTEIRRMFREGNAEAARRHLPPAVFDVLMKKKESGD